MHDSFVNVVRLMESPYSRDTSRKIASLKQWMGPKHFATLIAVIEKGELSATASKKTDVPASIVRAIDAIAMARDWEIERLKWGLDG